MYHPTTTTAGRQHHVHPRIIIEPHRHTLLRAHPQQNEPRHHTRGIQIIVVINRKNEYKEKEKMFRTILLTKINLVNYSNEFDKAWEK